MKFFCAASIIGIAFFTLTSFILPKKADYQETPVGTTSSLSQQIKVTLTSCDYNPNSKYLEAIVSIDAPISLVQQNYVVECYSSQKPTQKLNSNFFLTGLSTMIVQVHNLPKNFSYVSLKMLIESEQDTSNSSSSTRFNVGKNGVTIDYSLSEKTDTEYRITSIQNELKTAQNNIAEQEEKIAANDKKISDYQSAIETLEGEKIYQTDDEIKETDAAIDSKRNEITSLQKESAKCQEAISGYQNKINKLMANLEELQKK